MAVPVFALSVLAMTSCEKLKDDVTETAQSGEDFATDQTAISATCDMVSDIAETQGYMGKNGNSLLPDNVPIDYIDTVYTDGDGIEIVVDFGDPDGAGVLCNDGWTRTGKYRITTNAKRFSEVGSQVKLNFPQDRAKVFRQGSSEKFQFRMLASDYIGVTRKKANEFEIYYVFELSYTKDGTTTAYVAGGTYYVTQTAGMNVPGAGDDEFVVKGTANGKNRKYTEYNMTITEDLVRKVDKTCSKTFIKGKMEVKNDGAKSVLKLDFGDGSCDNEVKIILPGNIEQKYTVK